MLDILDALQTFEIGNISIFIDLYGTGPLKCRNVGYLGCFADFWDWEHFHFYRHVGIAICSLGLDTSQYQTFRFELWNVHLLVKMGMFRDICTWGVWRFWSSNNCVIDNARKLLCKNHKQQFQRLGNVCSLREPKKTPIGTYLGVWEDKPLERLFVIKLECFGRGWECRPKHGNRFLGQQVVCLAKWWCYCWCLNFDMWLFSLFLLWGLIMWALKLARWIEEIHANLIQALVVLVAL